jgi:hypothetical protein
VPGRIEPEGFNIWDFQYRAYIQNLEFEGFWTYRSQIGFPGILFSLLDQLTSFSPQQNLALYKALTSLLTALVLTAIIHWFHCQFGLVVSLAVLSGTVVSQWLTVYGRNLWCGTWAFYLPMIASIYVLAREESRGRHSNKRLALVIFAAMFVKCLFNGYEFITTVVVAMLVPFVYYGVRDKWPLSKAVRRVLAAALGAGSAMLATFVILWVQLWAATGDYMAGIRHVLYVLAKRSYGTASDFPEIYRASLRSNPVSVALRYLRSPAIDLTSWMQSGPWWIRFLLWMHFGHLVLIFLLATLFLLRWPSTRDNRPADARKKAGLTCAAWFSILAPLSWFVVFKAHSYIHLGMNEITWHVPFTLFGFALCGLVAERLGALVLSLRVRAAGAGEGGSQ